MKEAGPYHLLANQPPRMYVFFVPGRPVPLDRPRSFWNTRAMVPGIGLQNTRRVNSWKQVIQLHCLKNKAKPLEPLQGPVGLTVHFYVKPPAPDLSNLVKMVEDALNKMAWRDDRQIKRLTAYLMAVHTENLEGTHIEYEDITPTCSALTTEETCSPAPSPETRSRRSRTRRSRSSSK